MIAEKWNVISDFSSGAIYPRSTAEGKSIYLLSKLSRQFEFDALPIDVATRAAYENAGLVPRASL